MGFILLILCFAAWGAAANLTDIVVWVFRSIFDMSNFQSSLVQFAYYGAYFTLAPTGCVHHQPLRLQDRCAGRPTRAGFEPGTAFECEDLPTVRAYVAAGLGIAIVPALWGGTADHSTGQLRHLQITDSGASREVGMAWSTERRLLAPGCRRALPEHVLHRARAGLLPILAPPG